MIKLNVKSLQEFQRLTSHMEKNTIMPILTHMKLEYMAGVNVITKNNLGVICMAAIMGQSGGEYPTLLLDERITFGFIAETKSEELELTYTEDQIRISDARTSVGFSRLDPANFPKTPTVGTDVQEFTFTKEHLTSIGIARQFINEAESAGNFQFVHIGGETISAFHTHYFYVNNQYRGLPKILLSNQHADVLSTADQELKFKAQDNHYFFSSPSIRYIFTRQEGNSPSIDMVLERLKMPGKNFTIMKPDLVGFCNIANMVAETPVSLCTMQQVGKVARLTLTDTNYVRDGLRDIAITGGFDEFIFNARIVVWPLRTIPYEILECKTAKKDEQRPYADCLIVTGQFEYFCFTGMEKNTNV
jgi:hypothetical protein